MLHARLEVLRAGEDFRVALGEVGRKPAVADVAAPRVAACLAASASLAEAVPVAIVPGRDAARARAEDAFGRVLGATFLGDGAVASTLGWLLGQAASAGGLLLGIDVEDPRLRALDWELLVFGPGARALEALPDVRVVRVAPSPPIRTIEEPAAGPVGCWIAGGDPASVALARSLRACIEDAGLPATTAEHLEDLPPSAVLHAIAHGVSDFDGFTLLGGGAELASGTVAERAARLVRSAHVVILDVCESGTGADLDALACRLVAAGARCVIAPGARIGAAASTASSRAFYAAVATGQTLSSAVAAARSAVRGLAIPHPDSRWANWRVFVASVGAIDGAVPFCPLRFAWPPADAEARAALRVAEERAIADGLGFLGVEHLLAGLRASALPRARLASLELGTRDHPSAAALVRREASDAPALTPRARSVVDALGPGFGLGALADGLARVLSDGADDIAFDGVATVRDWRAGDAATWLEVMGGPEDGRRLAPGAGDRIGRWNPDDPPEIALYERTSATDPRLSRRHLRWLDGGRVEACQAVVRSRGEASERLAPGPCALQPGDVLALSAATVLRARSGAP